MSIPQKHEKHPRIALAILFISLVCTSYKACADIEVKMVFMNGEKQGQSAGSVIISETIYGLLFTPKLKGLTTGNHGFHVHENADCGRQGMNAGDHFDPAKTGRHLGPLNEDGHLGDLPVLYIDCNGKSTMPVLAPRIKKISEINHRSLMIHEGGDNYFDIPAKNGGGGGRMLCGAIETQ